MYDLAYYNPRMSGNVYRGTRKCGKTNCKCANSSKHQHSFWRLEYRVKHNGRWQKKREYVAKSKVKAFRQRIRRAKQKDRQRRQQVAQFMHQASEVIDEDGYAEVAQLRQLLFLSQQKLEPVALRQCTQLLKCLVKLIVKISL